MCRFKISLLLLLAAMLTQSLAALAVTDREMEQARTIAAQTYLRWANDGSGYLDDYKCSTMSELESKLKPKEKENLKAFNSVAVPTDYASWNKEKLVEFWGVTFFTSPKLTDKGKAARNTVRRRISAMNVSAPAAPAPKAEPEAKPEPSPAPETAPAAPEASPAEPAPAETPVEPTAQQVMAEQDSLMGAQAEIEADRLAAVESRHSKSDTSMWIYIVVLVILVGVVIWLVIFAARLMKGADDNSDDAEADSTRGEGAAAAGTAVAGNESARIKRLQAEHATELSERKAEIADRDASIAELTTRLERFKNDNISLRDRVESLNAEIRSLKERLQIAEGAAARSAATVATQPRAAEKPAPVRAESPREILNVIYLGRANKRGLFVRADRKLTPGHTIYRLDTQDGLVGTYRIVDSPEVFDRALENPIEMLTGGCVGLDLQDTDGYTEVITENAGTAVFEDGCWKVLRKARIRYE